MFEQDYIMRLVKEIIRMLLKLLFNLDVESPTSDLLENQEEKSILNALLDMVDAGNIDEAENQIYDLTVDSDIKHLETALLFYSYLNEKSDDFLNEHHFSREEIRSGLHDVVSRYGLEGMAGAFVPDDI